MFKIFIYLIGTNMKNKLDISVMFKSVIYFVLFYPPRKFNYGADLHGLAGLQCSCPILTWNFLPN